MWYDIFPSSLGDLLIAGNGDAVEVLHFQQGSRPLPVDTHWRRDPERFKTARQEMEAYLHGELQQFSVAVAPRGTAFQRQVWQALQEIPYGAVVSYRDIAVRIGRPQAVRAVGAANGANPVAVIVPCHRVIGSNGTLTGYAGGLGIKARLLQLEAGPAASRFQESLPLF